MPVTEQRFSLLEQILARERTQDSPLVATKEQLDGIRSLVVHNGVLVLHKTRADYPRAIPDDLLPLMHGALVRDLSAGLKRTDIKETLEVALKAAIGYTQKTESLFESTYDLMEYATPENLSETLRQLEEIQSKLGSEVKNSESDQNLKAGLGLLKIAALANPKGDTEREKRAVRDYLKSMVWFMKLVPVSTIDLFVALKIERAKALMELSSELSASYLAAPLINLKKEVDWKALHDENTSSGDQSNIVYLLFDKDNQTYGGIADKLSMKKKMPKPAKPETIKETPLPVPQEPLKKIDPKEALYHALTCGANLKPGFYYKARNIVSKMTPEQAEMLLPVFSRGTGFNLPHMMKKRPLKGKKQYDYLRWVEGNAKHNEAITRRMARNEYLRILRQ